MNPRSPVHIETPHPVYGLQWSAQGERLAFSGGFLYGGGYVGLADREGRVQALRDLPSLKSDPLVAGREPIFSSLCLDDSGTWLLASTCGYKWGLSGPVLFRVDGNSIVPHAAFELPETDDDWYPAQRAGGAWIHRGQLLIRYLAEQVEHTLFRWPVQSDMHASASRCCGSSGHVVTIGETAWIAKNQMNRYSTAGTGPQMVPGSDRLVLESHGLVAFSLQQHDPPKLHPLPREQRIQGLIRNREGTRLYAGTSGGEIVEWEVGTSLTKVRTVRHSARGTGRGLIARGIQALSQLADRTLASAHVNGSVALWRDGTCVREIELPRSWSPRSLAAHPTEPLLAVGAKKTGYEPGAVFIYNLHV